MNQLIKDILSLKKDQDAVIIAHFYQPKEIQDIADFVGDSLAMAKYGKASPAKVLIICGVLFMAESAKILSPHKQVLLPNPNAGCPMADMVDAQALADYKRTHKDHFIVSYVNTSAEVKALSDICVTSSNALSIIKQLDADNILFLPDKNLGSYINDQLPNRNMDLWPGYCFTHNRLSASDVIEVKSKYPDALTLAHPECKREVLGEADYIGSTAGIIQYAAQSKSQSFIIATEEGVLNKLQQDSQDKLFVPASPNLVCKNMKKTTLMDLHNALTHFTTEITVTESIRLAAYGALDKMLALS